jgi:replication factor C small subunit
MFSIWTEKYRPQEFKDIVGQDNIVNSIEQFVKTKELPHMLFAGPAGSGKSTTALIMAKKLFKDEWKQNFHELNASDERGINVIRNKVKEFARTKSIGDFPYKIIFLDEADSLTHDAQHALRRLMETYSEICRFILSCNYSSRIIEPIQSRCAVFRFKNIDKDSVKKRLEQIVKEEKLKINEEALDSIYDLSEGDMRKAINILQTVSTNSKNINKKAVLDIVAQVESKEVKEMLDLALNGSFSDARKILNEMILVRGVSGEDVIKQISKQIHDLNVPEKSMIELLDKIGEFEFRLDQGADPIIQLEALLAQFALKKK